MADTPLTNPNSQPELPQQLKQVLEQLGYKAPSKGIIEQLLQRADEQQEKTAKQQKTLDDLQDKLERGLKELNETRILLFFGFIVLLVMVAAMVIQSCKDESAKVATSYNSVAEKINILQTQLDNVNRKTIQKTN